MSGAGRGNKYGAKQTEYAGTLYASAREAAYAAELDARMRAGHVRNWLRCSLPIVLVDAGRKSERITYLPDFYVLFPDMTTEYVEVKGLETPVWKLKLKLYRAFGPPDVPLRIVYKDGREVVIHSRRPAA